MPELKYTRIKWIKTFIVIASVAFSTLAFFPFYRLIQSEMIILILLIPAILAAFFWGLIIGAAAGSAASIWAVFLFYFAEPGNNIIIIFLLVFPIFMCIVGIIGGLSTSNRRLRENEYKHRLTGLIPICANCKKIRDTAGSWHQVEDYFRNQIGAEFTHGLCPECTRIFNTPSYPHQAQRHL